MSEPSFQECYQRWSKALDGDQNSVRNSLTQPMGRVGMYQVLVCSWRIALSRNNDTKPCAELYRFQNNCFFESTASAIRRLLDYRGKLRPTEKRNWDDSVHSLSAILCDMKKNVALLTRANVAKATGRSALPETSLQGSGPSRWVVEDFHHRFDILSNNNGEATEDDQVSFDWFNTCDKVLKQHKKLVDTTSKYVAHLATPTSREGYDLGDLNLDRFKNALRDMFGIANFLRSTVLGGTEVASVQLYRYPLLEGVEFSWMRDDELKQLAKCWEDYQRETQSYASHFPAWSKHYQKHTSED